MLISVFDAIAIRRTAPPGAPGGPLDLGRLAESMLFYRKVRLAVTRHSLKQLISLGPDVALEIAMNPNVDLIYLDRDLALRTEDAGTRRERHRPATVTVMEPIQRNGETVHVRQPLESVVGEMFREATGKSGAGRRMARRFISQMDVHEFDPKLLELANEDWADEGFIRQVLVDLLHDLAPDFVIPSDFEASFTLGADDHFQFKTNLDWTALQSTGGSAQLLNPGMVMLGMLEMRQDLALGADLGAALAQDRLGERIMRTKCAELLAQFDGQQSKIDDFQLHVVKGVADLGGAINSGRRSFREFLDVLDEAEHFRSWLDEQTPTTDLVAAYYEKAFKKSGFQNVPLNKELTWMLPAAADFGVAVTEVTTAVLAGPIAATGMALLDRLVLDRFRKGWRPATFINSELMPFING